MTDIKWSQKEKSVSRAVFEKALKNECNEIIETVKKKATNLSEPKEIWELEDYLYEKRKEIDNKYDYRYSALILVFGRLVREGWITLKDLEGGWRKRSFRESISWQPWLFEDTAEPGADRAKRIAHLPPTPALGFNTGTVI